MDVPAFTAFIRPLLSAALNSDYDEPLIFSHWLSTFSLGKSGYTERTIKPTNLVAED
jgi:hypothetical protein